jgi:putative redox protein
MPNFEVFYQGNLRCKAEHIQSGTTILTDAPVDNQGKGESFSPTDLLAIALGTCMATVMGIEANNLKVNLSGTQLHINKVMGISPRRVVEIKIDVTIPDENFTENQKNKLIEIGINCPVAKSIHPDIYQNIEFNFVKK